MRRQAFLLLALAAAAIAVIAPAPRADGQTLSEIAVANARAKYAKAHTIYATFEGEASIRGDAPLPLVGRMAFLGPVAYRHEVQIGGLPKQVTLRNDDILWKWTESNGVATTASERRVSGPVVPQFPPSFESFEEGSIHDVRKIDATPTSPAVYVVEAKFKAPGAFASARIGIEDGTWIIRTLELIDAAGKTRMTLRFKDVEIDRDISAALFKAPHSARPEDPK